MSLEETLVGWTGPSSSTEQEKQERTERMVKNAVASWEGFDDASITVFAKGSYPNNTNVRADSDVDIAAQCHEVVYWDEGAPGVHPASTPYTGEWTPSLLRSELEKALRVAFPGEVDVSGSTAIKVHSSSARVDADVVPCFDYLYYLQAGGFLEGTRIFTKTGKAFENFPTQHFSNGRAKNIRTSSRFKQAVRILKRLENVMVTNGDHREVESFLIESLVYNCQDRAFSSYTWTDRIRSILVYIWDHSQGYAEPSESERLLEVNECKYLFGGHQSWKRADARDFAQAAWTYLGYTS